MFLLFRQRTRVYASILSVKYKQGYLMCYIHIVLKISMKYSSRWQSLFCNRKKKCTTTFSVLFFFFFTMGTCGYTYCCGYNSYIHLYIIIYIQYKYLKTYMHIISIWKTSRRLRGLKTGHLYYSIVICVM
jgi:hypothetical protein